MNIGGLLGKLRGQRPPPPTLRNYLGIESLQDFTPERLLDHYRKDPESVHFVTLHDLFAQEWQAFASKLVVMAGEANRSDIDLKDITDAYHATIEPLEPRVAQASEARLRDYATAKLALLAALSHAGLTAVVQYLLENWIPPSSKTEVIQRLSEMYAAELRAIRSALDAPTHYETPSPDDVQELKSLFASYGGDESVWRAVVENDPESVSPVRWCAGKMWLLAAMSAMPDGKAGAVIAGFAAPS